MRDNIVFDMFRIMSSVAESVIKDAKKNKKVKRSFDVVMVLGYILISPILLVAGLCILSYVIMEITMTRLRIAYFRYVFFPRYCHKNNIALGKRNRFFVKTYPVFIRKLKSKKVKKKKHTRQAEDKKVRTSDNVELMTMLVIMSGKERRV